MTKQAIVVGLGIGSLYVEQLATLGYDVITIDKDSSKNPTYTDVKDLVTDTKVDIAIVCVPNFLHRPIAEELLPYAKIVMIEKPGLKDATEYRELLAMAKTHDTRVTIVKNNFYRPYVGPFMNTIVQAHHLTGTVKSVEFVWNNKNRVPSPGTWFTTKSLAWGGVSRDLMPHLINELQILTVYENAVSNTVELALGEVICEQRHTLASLANSTDYGTADADGTYDVDDYAEINYLMNNLPIKLRANWKSGEDDFVGVIAHLKDGSKMTLELGLCPAQYYGDMIATLTATLDEEDCDIFWENQVQYDISMLEILSTFDTVPTK